MCSTERRNSARRLSAISPMGKVPAVKHSVRCLPSKWRSSCISRTSIRKPVDPRSAIRRGPYLRWMRLRIVLRAHAGRSRVKREPATVHVPMATTNDAVDADRSPWGPYSGTVHRRRCALGNATWTTGFKRPALPVVDYIDRWNARPSVARCTGARAAAAPGLNRACKALDASRFSGRLPAYNEGGCWGASQLDRRCKGGGQQAIEVIVPQRVDRSHRALPQPLPWSFRGEARVAAAQCRCPCARGKSWRLSTPTRRMHRARSSRSTGRCHRVVSWGSATGATLERWSLGISLVICTPIALFTGWIPA